MTILAAIIAFVLGAVFGAYFYGKLFASADHFAARIVEIVNEEIANASRKLD